MAGKKLRGMLSKVHSGRSDANLAFGDLIALLDALGFEERIRGDHHVLWKAEIINLQPAGSKAKPYQVKQVRAILAKYVLGSDDA